MKALCVLAVGAHPDDVEIHCSGTLKTLKNPGVKLHIATMTVGDCGSKQLSPLAIARKRQREAERAAALLGATYRYVGSSDFGIFNDDTHNRKVTAVVRMVAPDIVFTHPPTDYLSDHEITSTLVRNACFYASVKNYDTSKYTEAKSLKSVPHLYYFDAMEGVDLFGKLIVPEFYVDIGDVINFKSRMLSQHASQRSWLLAQHRINDYLLSMVSWAQLRGKEAARVSGQKIRYAEAFRQHRGHAYPRANRIHALLGKRVIANPSYSAQWNQTEIMDETIREK